MYVCVRVLLQQPTALLLDKQPAALAGRQQKRGRPEPLNNNSNSAALAFQFMASPLWMLLLLLPKQAGAHSCLPQPPVGSTKGFRLMFHPEP